MPAFVLISGAWHASWCWERIVPLLNAAGHRVIAPDLLGMGGDTTPSGTVTLAAWADQVAALLAAEPEPVILVGHSRAGVIISEVAERVPEKIRFLVYLAAFLLPNGETIGHAAGLDEARNAELLMPGPADTCLVRPERVGPVFYNTTEPTWQARAAALLGPELNTSFTAPIVVTEARFGSVPRAYIECTQDNAVPIALQRSMHAALPCHPVITLETDHSPFYSAPDLLLQALLAIP